MSIRRRLETSIPSSSNLSKDEHFFYAWKTFSTLSCTRPAKVRLSSQDLSGLYSPKEKIGLFFLCDKEYPGEFINTGVKKAAFGRDAFLFMYRQLKQLPINRMFTLKCLEGGTVKVSDSLMEASFVCRDVFAVTPGFSVRVDSSLLYFFRLNPKTLNKKAVFYLTPSHVLFHLPRKKDVIAGTYPTAL